MKCGGISNEEKPAGEDIQQIVNSLKDEIHAHAKKTFPHLKAVSYKSQVVAGTNYFIKVHAGNEHIHLRVHKPLPVHGDKPQLSSIQLGKQQNDPITFF